MNTRSDPSYEDTARHEETLRVLADWFDDDAPTREPANLLSATLWRTARTRRRASWRDPERWLAVTLIAKRPMTASPLRLVLILLMAVLLTAALAGGAALVGSQLGRLGLQNPRPNAALSAVALLPTACPAGMVLKSGDIATVAGTGIAFQSGDGGQAIAADIEGPYATVAADVAGAVYISGPTGRIVRRIGTDGVISTFVALESFAPLSFPMGLGFDAGGDLYVADPGNLRTPFIWKVDPAGAMTHVAGIGVFGSTGNDGPALNAEVDAAQVAVGPQGDLYIDGDNGFRTIDPAGVIHAFAGTGVAGFSGDGGPAVDATMGLSEAVWLGVAADAAGNVYLGDPSNYRIRKVDAAGIITTVAGTGVSGYSGDGGPAAQATISSLSGLAVDSAGDIYFADTGNNAVRKIDPAGIITTVAGAGNTGFSGDCGPATSAQLNGPTAVAVHDGILYIVDSNNNRVRMVVP